MTRRYRKRNDGPHIRSGRQIRVNGRGIFDDIRNFFRSIPDRIRRATGRVRNSASKTWKSGVIQGAVKDFAKDTVLPAVQDAVQDAIAKGRAPTKDELQKRALAIAQKGVSSASDLAKTVARGTIDDLAPESVRGIASDFIQKNIDKAGAKLDGVIRCKTKGDGIPVSRTYKRTVAKKTGSQRAAPAKKLTGAGDYEKVLRGMGLRLSGM